MKELPYFKFYPNQWITGSISFLHYEEQGAFMKVCCFYWSKGCKVTYEQYEKIIPDYYRSLINLGIVKHKDKNIYIDWLDEQLEERKAAHIKRVNAGRKGGKTTQNKQSSSNAKALKKDKKRKEAYMSTKSIDEYLKQKQNANK